MSEPVPITRPDGQPSKFQVISSVGITPTPNPSSQSVRLIHDTTKQSQLGNGDNGDGGRMEHAERLTRLETHFEYIQKDLGDLKAGQQRIGDTLTAINEKLAGLPTKSDLSSWRTQWIAICVGAIALIVGGIIGGLAWIKPDTAPIIIRPDGAQGSTGRAANIPSTAGLPDAPAPPPSRPDGARR